MSRTVERIAKLLAKADGAKTVAEQAAYMAKAEMLAKLAEISLAEARLATPEQKREQPTQQRIVVGRPRQQANRHMLRLLSRLGRANGLVVGLYSDNTSAVLFGLPSDIATVETMFAHIGPQMVRMAEEYRQAGTWQGEWVIDVDGGFPRRMNARIAKANFYAGFVDEVARRVEAAARKARRQATADEHFHHDPTVGRAQPTGQSGAEIALRAKDDDVREFAARHLGRGSWRGGDSRTPRHGGSLAAGARAGSRASIGAAASLGGKKRALGS